MNGSTNLEELFERYESLPSQDAEDEKREVVDRILSAVAQRLAPIDAGDDLYRGVRDAAARVRLLAPGAEGFDDAVLDLIDDARDALGQERLTDVVPVRPPSGREGAEPAGEKVTEASEESFPASDPPGIRRGRRRDPMSAASPRWLESRTWEGSTTCSRSSGCAPMT